MALIDSNKNERRRALNQPGGGIRASGEICPRRQRGKRQLASCKTEAKPRVHWQAETDVIVQARERTRDINLFVDIKHIPELMSIEYSADSGLTIGAATPCYQLYGDSTISELYPALVDSALANWRHGNSGPSLPGRQPV